MEESAATEVDPNAVDPFLANAARAERVEREMKSDMPRQRPVSAREKARVCASWTPIMLC